VATVIDAHQHLWNLERVDYPWLVPEYGPLYRTYEYPELEPQLREAGVDGTVLVQAADSYEDTEYMLEVADQWAYVTGVVGWVPLLRPEDAARALDRFRRHPKFRGMRHLIHEEKDPDWLLQDVVTEGLRVLAERGMTFDVVAVLPRHLEHVPVIAERLPELRMVIDHLAKPPIKEKGWEPWASLIARAAEYPTVYAKVSGLNTAADWENWSAEDLKPYINHSLEAFGPKRLMFGGDWPVVVLAGDYQKWWEETNRAFKELGEAERSMIFGGTAIEFYGLEL
jgi:L-fuconolactonase